MARTDPPPPGAAKGPTGPPDREPRESGAGESGAGESGARESGAGGGGFGSSEDTLRRLEERLDRASGAAERLVAEAAAESAARAAGAAESAARAAGAFRRPPPSGWQQPAGEDAPGRGGDLDLLVQLLDSLRDLIPSELQKRLADAVKELLLAVRALINWYLERLEKHADEPAEVQDIPISWD